MFYIFERHVGNDNDNSVSEGYVEAETLEEACEALQKHLEAKHKDVDIGGDHADVTAMWFENEIPHHEDFYSIAMGSKEPDKACVKYHAWDGELV